MSYDYQKERALLFKEENQGLFLQIRDKIHKLLSDAGAVRMNEIMLHHAGSTWIMLACVDRLVELGEIREIPTNGAAQERIFVSNKCHPSL